MEVVVMLRDLDKMRYNQRLTLIDTWITAAKKNGCDRIIFDMGGKETIDVPTKPASTKPTTERTELEKIADVVRKYLHELNPDNDTIEISATEPIVLAHATTEDDKHVIDVTLLIKDLTMMFYCDHQLVHSDEFESPGIMLMYLDGMTHKSLIENAELWCLPTYKDDKR